ncbi:Putative L-lactate dehydrogenase operon regulatory protein [Burkholderiales bacterium]|nr:Putative L-lactate dehydrogenase operon regulatory protein [Burkholderiales bacterium]
MPLTMVEPLRLYRRIADQIAELIDRGEFRAGSRLPAERELARELGVSRTSVREAIISLEIAGKVEVRVGNGIFVRTRPAGARRDADDGPGPFELLAARRMIEGEIAAAAAKLVKRSDLAALRATLDAMRDADGDAARRDLADREFHVRIAEATRNGALAHVVDALWEQRRGELWTRIEGHFHTPELRLRTLEDHAAIVDALAAGDPVAARAAMRRHLARVAREFQRRLEPGAGAHGAARGPADADPADRKSGAVAGDE